MDKTIMFIERLHPGDIFCTFSSGKLSSVINAVQKFHATDNEASYSHAGIITDSNGGTFESLWTIRRSSLDKYIDKPILIGRHKSMNKQLAETALRLMSDYEGQKYPVHRLFYYLCPPIAKYLSTGQYLVCSELVSTFLFICRAQTYWKGVTPDHIADMIQNYESYDVVYSGRLTKVVLNCLKKDSL
jgi:hypothetical protein